MPLDRGTLVCEFTVRPVPEVSGGAALVIAGISKTFSNTIYMSRIGATGLGVTYTRPAASAARSTEPVPSPPAPPIASTWPGTHRH